MVHTLEQRVQRRHHYAIIDEVDSILIDEARTPLIISGPVGKDTSTPFKQYNALVSNLYKKQTRITNELVAEAEKHLEQREEGDDGRREAAGGEAGHAEAPEAHEAVRRRAPRCRRWCSRSKPTTCGRSASTRSTRCSSSPWTRRGTTCTSRIKGIDELSPNDPDAFVSPDLSEEMGAIEEDETSHWRRSGRHPGAGGELCRQEPEDARHPSAPEGLHALPEGREVHHR